jgi:hypothetical protein
MHGATQRQSNGRRAAKAEYFVGVIDILQMYSTRKMAETWYKKTTMSADKASGISALGPGPYADRFVDFMDRNSR